MLSESTRELSQTNVTDKLNSSTNLNIINNLNVQQNNNNPNQNLENVNKLDTHREIEDSQASNRVNDNMNQNLSFNTCIIQKETIQNNINIHNELKNSKTLLATQLNKKSARVKSKSSFKSSLTVINFKKAKIDSMY